MENTSSLHIRLVSPSSREEHPLLTDRLAELTAKGLKVSYHKLAPDPSWPFSAGSSGDRIHQILEALADETVSALLAVRGGYGASELLAQIPWTKLASLEAKPIIGFSDVSALHAAFFTKLGWHGIHAAMPATDYWQENGRGDTDALVGLLKGEIFPINLPLLYLGKGLSPHLTGWGFGGCLSVLTNLIGTPYLPKTLDGALLYWEDVGEHPARVLRFVNQWQLSGLLKGVRGLVLGRFVGCDIAGTCSETQLREELASRMHIPVWFCPSFGHCSPNWPLPIGGKLKIERETLTWNGGVEYGD